MFISVRLFATLWTVARQVPHTWNFPDKNTGMDCHFLLQRIFPTQGSNPDLPHCRHTLYRLSHEGSLVCWLGNTRTSSEEGNGTPLQYSCLKNSIDGGAWWAAVHGVTKSWARLSDLTFTFHFHALEREMATHSSVLAWRIPGMGEPGGLPSMGSHRVGLN